MQDTMCLFYFLIPEQFLRLMAVLLEEKLMAQLDMNSSEPIRIINRRATCEKAANIMQVNLYHLMETD